MANGPIKRSFDRLWQHTIMELNNKSDIDHTHADLVTQKQLDTKMDKKNPSGTGNLSLNGNAWFAGNVTVGPDRKQLATLDDLTNINVDVVGKTSTGSHAEIFNNYDDNIASGEYSHAEGGWTIAAGDYSHTEGKNVYTLGEASHAEGRSDNVMPRSITASSTNDEVLASWDRNGGHFSLAKGEASHVEGYESLTLGRYSHAEGFRTASIGISSHTEGEYTEASGDYSHAEGSGTIASGHASHTEGGSTIAAGSYSHAEGYHTNAFGPNSHAEGYGYSFLPNGITSDSTNEEIINIFENDWNGFSLAKGWASHTEGKTTLALAEASHSEGFRTITVDFASHAEGSRTIAYGSCAHAEGSESLASGEYSHAEGAYTKASGISSHVEGYRTTALGHYSHAEGFSSNILPDGITSDSTNEEIINIFKNTLGGFSLAKGEVSHSEGVNTLALGDYSHAEGSSTIAYGFGAHAEGSGTIASGLYQHVQGKFNIEDTENKYAHIVGNGNSNPEIRSNAHTLDWDGNAWFAGNVTVGPDKKQLATLDDIAAASGGENTTPLTEEEIIAICDFDGEPEGSVIPIATRSTPGCVIPGNGLTVDINGVISVIGGTGSGGGSSVDLTEIYRRLEYLESKLQSAVFMSE